MRRLAEFSVRNRVLVNLLTLFVLGAGLVIYLGMRRELFPEFSRRAIMIDTVYAGASPEEIETLITSKIEEEVGELDGLDELLSISQEGRSEILLKFRPDTDMSQALDDVRAALDDVTDLPAEAERSRVREVKSTFPVITVSLAGEVDEATLRRTARTLKEELRRIPGVAAVRVLGIREQQIWVEVDPARVDQYRLSLDDIRAAIAAHNRNVPGGTLKTPRGEVLVRTLGEAAGPRDVERIIVRSLATGTPLTVADVATVRETFEEPTVLSRFAGRPSINLVLVKERTGDAIDIAATVRRTVEQARARLPETMTLGVFNDFSSFIRNRLDTLRTSGVIGLAIVLVTLWAFVRTRVALLTAFGIPFAMLGAVLAMTAWGISLNMISLFGLILVLGLLVDDAIVVAENVYRHVEGGMDPRRAAVQGTSEVAWPVVATVVTTVAAFLPLLLIPGTMGIFLAPIPLVVTFALIASLFEALIVLPSHLADALTPGYAQRVRHASRPWFRPVRRAYDGLLGTALRWRYIAATLIASVSVLIAATGYYRVPFVLFREFESSQFFVNFETSTANTIEDTLEVAKRAEQVVLGLPPGELRSVATNVGITFLDVHRAERGPNLGQLMVELQEDRPRSVDAVIADLRAGMADIPGITKVQFLKTQAGPAGPAVEVQVTGDEIRLLRDLADQVKAFLQGIPGVRDVRDDFTEGKEEVRITLRPEARALGLDLSRIARQVQQGFLGVEASAIQRRDEEVPIVVRFPESARRDPDALATLRLTLASGEQVFLRDVAVLETVVGANRIRRVDQKRAITVLADISPGEANAFQIGERLTRRFADVPRQLPGYRVAVRGERQEAEASLAVLPEISLVAVLLIYFILGSLFRSFTQPLVVLAVIPFALDGVVIGHLVMGQALSFLSVMGLVALIGVVVNDSLILVDFVNRARQAGTPRDQAIQQAGVARLRPVLLTTATTVGGLIPLAFFATGEARFLSPMAVAVVWGLSFATVLTLVMVPCLYAILDDVVEVVHRLAGVDRRPPERRDAG